MTPEERAAAVDQSLRDEATTRLRVLNRVLVRSHAKTHVLDCWCQVRRATSPVAMRMVALIFEHPRYRMFGEINYA
jgi:hypothetical protein